MSAGQYLADTHILLWALVDDKRLRDHHRNILLSDAKVFFSAVSLWEVAIKKSLGKLIAPENLADLLGQTGFCALHIKMDHAEAVEHLPFHHSDPFDRLLIVQGQLEKLVIMTVDKSFTSYEVETI
ncbi:MAG: type II toxin-antitoxin system VapC family toxin [Hyphomicrobiaceae bacterium]|nr:type II toxin-antitoxin system VapC family toxin [Hyphomicrobiaceae bacterium]